MIQVSKLRNELNELQSQAQLRSLITQTANPSMPSFCSNDYLGLKHDSRLIEAAQQAIDVWGVGTGSAHLIEGHTQIHAQLEERLAEFVGADKALLFSTGYMANLAVLTAFAKSDNVIVMDKLNHASLIDGAQLSQAKFQRYNHNDMAALQRRLSRLDLGQAMVVSDSVFSMDGDIAPITELVAEARMGQHSLFLDEAHGLGVIGPKGRGAFAESGETLDDRFILMGTMGKAFGTAGAFVAGQSDVIDYLVNKARPFIYTTAMPAAIAAATLKSLNIIESNEGDDLRARLAENITYFRSSAKDLGWNLMNSATAIQPILMGSSERAVQASQALAQKGFRVPAIRPPTVPKGLSRLRVTLMASHSKDHIDQFLTALGRCDD